MKNTKKQILLMVILLILQTIIYVFVGMNKAYLHIDEAYSYGLSNYERIEIQDNEDFFDNWHTKDYYKDYLSIQEDEVGDFKPVYENQKNDVHPPLYYFLLRIAMEFNIDNFSIWTGIILNIIIYLFITIFMYLILKKIFKEEKYSNEKSLILAFMSSIILASLSNVVYIRMYTLLTLDILITIYLHIKLLENEKVSIKLLICIGISALIGVLTHYYYLFFLVILYLIFLIKYIKEKEIKKAIYYTLTMLIAGILSLIIFPYSLNHMFFGYRGQGVISNLKNIDEIVPSLLNQIYLINYYVFNNLLLIILIIIIGSLIYKKICKKEKIEISKEKKEILNIIWVPTLFFFIITAIASPWKVLRYIVPVCGIIFVLVIYYLYKLLQTISNEKISNIIIIILFALILIAPFALKLEPELMYTEKKEIVQELGGELNLPTIYWYDSGRGGFLDNILLFSIIDESYVAKDIECAQENVQKILENKDISNGIILFISEGQDTDIIIDKVKGYLNLKNDNHLQKLNACDVYYLF